MELPQASPQRLTLLDLPLEIVLEILHHLSCKDLFALRRVSKEMRKLFCEEELCIYAHRLYFPRSSEITRDVMRPYPGFLPLPYASGRSTRSRKDFDAAYYRTRNWKRGQPTEVEVIDRVADGSVLGYESILVADEEGLLVYQQSRGILVIRDLNRPLRAGAQVETVIDLRAELGECIMLRARDLMLRDGDSIRIRINRGLLLVVGEAHEHQIAHDDYQPESSSANQTHWSSLWNWALGTASAYTPPLSQPKRILQEPHSLCAVFSARPQDQGRLLQKWTERDTFMALAAFNEHYCIAEFHLIEQKLEGVIYNKDGSGWAHHGRPMHHFTMRKKADYPHLSTFDIAADTKGKVFYLGFLPPPDRRPVVEVISIPTQNEDGTWTEPTVIKRVVLRTLAKHIETGGADLLRSYWIDFDNAFEVNKYTRGRKFYGWENGEDVIRLKLTGYFAIEGVTKSHEKVTMITWYITARPSPKLPSSIMQWRTGQDWKDDHTDRTMSPWADKHGDINLQECYPTPTYYSSPAKRQAILFMVPDLPDAVDIDRYDVWESPNLLWLGCNKFATAIYYAEDGEDFTNPATVSYSTKNEEYSKDIQEHFVPYVPGFDDHSYCPLGRHLSARYKVCLQTGERIIDRKLWEAWKSGMGEKQATSSKVLQAISNLQRMHLRASGQGGTQMLENLPMPGNSTSIMKGRLDRGDKRFLIYGQVSSSAEDGYKRDKIVIVRFD